MTKELTHHIDDSTCAQLLGQSETETTALEVQLRRQSETQTTVVLEAQLHRQSETSPLMKRLHT